MNDDDHTEAVIRLSSILRVIADEKRLRILQLLVQQESCVCEIMARLELGQSLVSHHLAVLKQAGLVRDRRDAQWVYYSIDQENLAELNAAFLTLLGAGNLAPAAAFGASPTRC